MTLLDSFVVLVAIGAAIENGNVNNTGNGNGNDSSDSNINGTDVTSFPISHLLPMHRHLRGGGGIAKMAEENAVVAATLVRVMALAMTVATVMTMAMTIAIGMALTSLVLQYPICCRPTT